MIVTVTANPSVDRTIEIDSLQRGAVLRTRSALLDAGGKGVNVARALAANGVAATAVLPTGGAEGVQLTALLATAGITVVEVPIAGAVRSNITIAEADGTTTKLNEPGPRLDAAERARLVAATLDAAEGADWVVLCGSLPPGLPADFYADLTLRLRERGARVAVDTSGDALRAAVAGRPDLVKPNREELADLVGHEVRTLGDALSAAREVLDQGVATVVASVGAEGALLVTADGAWHAHSTFVEPRSTVGAGDALLAGFLAAGHLGPDALADAVAWGAAAAALPGSRMPTPAELDRAAVRCSPAFDPAATLTEN
ncbi:1-phosphofructokinase [Actinokineospora alba]|uniref:1-phosphofructokinase n=1 Tax=Actinokineospora alba TaxID=504798 RepID=A0A1H0K235_9PSEU|nr:1-phosphofructokinase [Actinokineospora alba]TDP68073.1 1-phosphofructokinase [Actinokineospora alba]SDH91903.1 1-phosphofructokinase [Actinokineospora alba]SDO50075.1 1-phosphofructokinase [Actinokineospora alba]